MYIYIYLCTYVYIRKYLYTSVYIYVYVYSPQQKTGNTPRQVHSAAPWYASLKLFRKRRQPHPKSHEEQVWKEPNILGARTRLSFDLKQISKPWLWVFRFQPNASFLKRTVYNTFGLLSCTSKQERDQTRRRCHVPGTTAAKHQHMMHVRCRQPELQAALEAYTGYEPGHDAGYEAYNDLIQCEVLGQPSNNRGVYFL